MDRQAEDSQGRVTFINGGTQQFCKAEKKKNYVRFS